MIKSSQDRRRLIFFNKRYGPHHRQEFVRSRLNYRLIKILNDILKGGGAQ